VKPLFTIARRLGVLGRVCVEHRLAGLDLVGVEVLERGRAGLRREGAPVLQHSHHVVVAGDAPEPLAVLPVVPVHGRLVAHQRERLVWDPLCEGVVVEVDIGQRLGHEVLPSRICSVFRSQ
jgi:hypothetical protein